MSKILVCVDEYKKNEHLEYYLQEIKPDLIQAGHEVCCTTRDDILIISLICNQTFILIALKRQSPSWNIARCLRSEKSEKHKQVFILMIMGYGPEDSPDDPAYFASPKYQELYDSYYPGWDFATWIEDVTTLGPITRK